MRLSDNDVMVAATLAAYGRAGLQVREFNGVNAIDCRTAGQLYVAEMGSWRVQKISLH